MLTKIKKKMKIRQVVKPELTLSGGGGGAKYSSTVGCGAMAMDLL